MSASSDEQLLLDQIQHYPEAEYLDINDHTHRCYTTLHNEYLYYTHIDPFDRGVRRQPNARRRQMNIGVFAIPPITRKQLAKLTSAVPFADVEALFEPMSYNISNVMRITHGDPSQLFLYAVFVTNMRAYKPADCAPHAYTRRRGIAREVHVDVVVTEQLFWFDGSLVNYARLIIENPVYAYCDTRLLSHDGDCIVDHAGTYHNTRYATPLWWACRHVPLGKQTMFSERGRIPCHGCYEEDGDAIITGRSNRFYTRYDIDNPIVSWVIERGMVFYALDGDCISMCKKCRDLEPCIRTRAGEPYTCAEISCSYYWQYQILTAFGPAEHARYVQVCKMIYG